MICHTPRNQLEVELIALHPFDEKDFDHLIAEISDARFLLQWAGPKYTYSLDAGQLSDTLANTAGEKPSYRAFKAVRPETRETVGHIQLVDIDYNASIC